MGRLFLDSQTTEHLVHRQETRTEIGRNEILAKTVAGIPSLPNKD